MRSVYVITYKSISSLLSCVLVLNTFFVSMEDAEKCVNELRLQKQNEHAASRLAYEDMVSWRKAVENQSIVHEMGNEFEYYTERCDHHEDTIPKETVLTDLSDIYAITRLAIA
jgi:hypothetical protein